MNSEKEKILSLIEIKDKNILDVGCGDGRYAEYFSDECFKYVGIDIDSQMINENNKSNKNKNCSYCCANIIDYKRDFKFDIIILSLAFHEIDIKEQGLALINMTKLLNRNGKIIILDPAIDDYSFQRLWNVAYDNLIYFNHDFVVKHSKEVIEKAALNKLFKITKRDKLNLEFKFESIEEIVTMILESDEFKLIRNDKRDKEKLQLRIKDFLKDINNIVLEDKLDITILELE